MAPENSDDDDSSSSSSRKLKWRGYIRCDDIMPPICDHSLTVTQGFVNTTEGVTVSYWRYTPDNLDKNYDPFKYPIVVINGGPGLPHNYIKPARNLACDGREVVMYDQAGTGASYLDDENSTDFATMYPELLTLDYYAHTELPALIEALGWNNYHVLAESWGTQIALEFAVGGKKDKGPPAGLQSLLLNAPIADNPRFINYQWDPVDGTVGTLPTYTQERLLHFNRTRDFDNPEFQAFEEAVMETFNARIGLLVDCWLETEDAGISIIPYDKLTGVSDIFIPDADVDMRGWSALSRLHRLKNKVPIQLNHGAYDMVRPKLIADTAAAVGGSAVECHLLPRAAHSILLDSPREVYGFVQDFITRVETASRPGSTAKFTVKDGSCPTHAILQAREDWRSSSSSISSSRPFSVTEVAVLALLAVISAFFMGIRIGSRRNKKYTQGYEEVVPANNGVELE